MALGLTAKLRIFVIGLGVTGALAGFPAACGGGSDEAEGTGGGQGKDGGKDATLNLPDGLSGPCVPRTCAEIGATCGPQADGCGDVVQCGTCTAPEFCGGAGPSKCGVGGGTEGGVCVPKTCADLKVSCGQQGDGCGAVIDCGTCTAPEFCGGGGPSICGDGTSGDGGGGPCTPTKTSCATDDCGPISDGCGGLVQCGTCTAPQICGGGGTPSKCGGFLPDGGVPCTPITCAAAGADCGPIGDGCGGLIASCGTCVAPAICGGGGVPSNCGGAPDGGTACVNFCKQQVTCDGGGTTTVTGTVFAPNGTLPLPNAFVYVPNGATTFPYGVQAFVDGVAGGTCDQCSTLATGNPLVSVTSGTDGTFTLNNVPVGTGIPLVIQVGRWRRLITINVSPCQANPLTAAQTRLPVRQAEGNTMDNIPLFAIATGDVDALECVIRKLGVQDNQFTNPSGTGRIRFYQDNGARINTSTPGYATLYGTQAELDKYDALIFACRGGSHDIGNTAQRRVIDVATNTSSYVNKGGRAFFTHFSYSWLYDIAPSNALPWPGTTSAAVNHHSWNSTTGRIDDTFTKGQTFAAWLALPAVNALSANNPPRISLDEARHNMDSPLGNLPAQRWIYNYQDNPEAATLHLTFNTPWGAQPASQCGRVLFSSFHVTTNSSTNDVNFPNECDNNAMTPQEKVLAFMLFDLTSCIQPDNPPPPTCTPLTCAQQNIGCGPAGDGCGGVIQCGPCPPGQTCGGGGVPGQCGGPSCTPTTCAAAGANCGDMGDGCGGVLHCGDCVPGQACGGQGPNQCGPPGCVPITCAQLINPCGKIGDGCGNLIDCGVCQPGQICGGGGVPYQCGTPSCTPATCQSLGVNCGAVADGCGGLLQCGVCVAPATCGGGGTPNKCGIIK